MSSSPIVAAKEWVAADPDPTTRRELEGLIEAGAEDELAERMAGSLEFGTAGLRGAVEAGSNRMNRAVVIRTTRGLADHLLAERGDDAGPVVVGHDARLSSRSFMEDTVAVLDAAGLSVQYFDEPVPTPLVAFLAREMGAHAAVVITASHNPPQDNGYKVYAPNGAQIVPPRDRQIATAIDGVGPATHVPRTEPPLGGSAKPVPADYFSQYLASVAHVRPDVELDQQLGIVYTPLHGVGGRFVVGALQHFGYDHVHPVAEQFAPDGRFPTVSFPNPEEPGALDLALAQASDLGADLVVANDPDTDRLAVALPGPDGAWSSLTGNQIGVLLADFLLAHTVVTRPLVINSIVSTPMLGDIAKVHGARWEQTLTGFKWIWNAALDLAEAEGVEYVFGFEEALGYSAGPAVRDKDGISASVLFADLAANARAEGSTVRSRLDALYRRHGMWVSTQRSIVRPGTEGAQEIADAMERLGREVPEQLGSHPVTGVVDYRTGAEHRPRYLGRTPLVILSLADAGRLLVRPSGTEPKLKIYADLRSHVGASDDLSAAEHRLRSEADDLTAALAGHLRLE